VPLITPGGYVGHQPVGCVLSRAAAVDVSASGASYTFDWDHLSDNTFAGNPLAALPAGIGFTTAFNGSGGGITFTSAGVWAFTLGVNYTLTDATWVGFAGSQFGGNLNMALPLGGGVAGATDVLTASVDDFVQYRILTRTSATGAVTATATLSVVRLA
jgi:hypothetical protein